MLEDALRFPLKGERSVLRLLAGGALAVVPFPFLVVGMVFSSALLVVGVVVAVAATTVLYGYLVAVLRASTSPDPTPPRFSDWGTLLVEGLLAMVVWVAYLVPVVVPAALYAGWLHVSGTGPDTGSAGSALFLLTLVASVGLVLVGYYLAPAALANYVHAGQARAAFDLRAVLRTAATREYAVAWGLAAVVYLTVGTAASILQFLLVGFVVYFYTFVVMTYLCGRGFADALAADGSSDGHATPTADPMARDG